MTGSGGPRPGDGAPEPRSRRLFFALWPDAAMRERLAGAVREAVHDCGGRPVPLEQWHLTLAFLGAVPAERIADLATLAPAAALAADLPEPGLELSLGRLADWPQPQVRCVLPIEPSPALGRLARALADSLSAAGFLPDLKPFHAHVTVARKVTRPSEPRRLPVVRWRFERFALLESRTLPSGAVYSVVETYPLCSPAWTRK
ncbi:MAG: RNA 2',3'-cyclic phosphodiesterase [Steroidobacteraceae bacterium]